jgi:hypothetical protein
MPILRTPADLADWQSATQGNLIDAHQELVTIIPAMRPSSGANFTTVELLSKETIDLDPLAPFFEPSNPWEDTLHQLRSAQRDLVTKHWVERNTVTGPIDAMIYGLSLVPRATPIEGTAIHAMTKLLEGQRAVLERGVLQRQAEKRAALARHAIRRLMREDNQPYGALFPLGNPEQAKENIMRAQALMRAELADLDPDMREAVLHGMLDAMTTLVDGNPPAQGGGAPEGLDEPYDAEAAKKDGQDALLATKGAKKIIERKQEDMQAATSASVTLVKILMRLESEGRIRPSEEAKLKELGKTISDATGAAKSVIAAAEALGLPADTAEDLNKAVAIVSNAAMLYVGLKTNPAQAITAGANLITLFAGRKRKDPAAIRHEAVMNALNAIFRQNQQIMENQRIIFESLDRLSESVYAMQRNQAALFELGLVTLNAVLLNRGLLIRATAGPLALMDDAVTAFEDMRGQDGLTYTTLRRFFSAYTGDVKRGLRLLRDVLRSTSDIHPVLLQSTYRDGRRGEVRSEGRVSYFEVASSADGQRRDEDEKRYALCRAGWLRGGMRRDPRILTEFGTYDAALDGMGRLDLGLKHTWDGSLPPSLLDVGLVWKFAALALRSHFFHQFLSELTGPLALRSLEDIKANPSENDLGKRLLEKALAHVDCALAQSYLMTGRFASIDYLSGLWNNDPGEVARIMIELDRNPREGDVQGDADMTTHVLAMWSVVHENDYIRVDTGWIDTVPDLLPEFSDFDAVRAAVARMEDLRSRIDGFMYTLSGEDQDLVDEYFDLINQGEIDLEAYKQDYFRYDGAIRLFYGGFHEDVEYYLGSIETPLDDLPVDLRAIAEGIGGLIDEGKLSLPWTMITDGRFAHHAKDAIVTLAEHFRVMGRARQVGVDHPDVAERVPEAMKALSLYEDLPDDAFRGGTKELQALRAALIAALAEYDVSEATEQPRQVMNVAIALAALDIEVPDINVT